KDVLFCRFQPKRSPTVIHQIVIPKSLRCFILTEFHDSIFGAHFSSRKILPAIQMRYWWPRMENDVIAWCQNCDVCLQRKVALNSTSVPLQPIEVSAPFE